MRRLVANRCRAFPNWLILVIVITISALALPAVASATGTPVFLFKWGSTGSGDSEFSGPTGIAIDSLSNVYVADTFNNRIQKFTSTGIFITKWGRNGGDGSSGTGDGEFSSPSGITVDTSGNVYIADTQNHRIQKFTSTGTFITKWGRNGGDGSSGSNVGEFYSPSGVAVNPSGNIYVVDRNNDRIQYFTDNGTFISLWGFPGTGDGAFSQPWGAAFNSSNFIYITDTNNQRIEPFDYRGAIYPSPYNWGSFGSGDGQFNEPVGIAIDSSDNVYVADFGNHRIQEFTSTGNFITKWGTFGSGDGEFYSPFGIAINSSGNIYVADRDKNRVQVFGFVAPTITNSTGADNITYNSARLNGNVTYVDGDNPHIIIYWGPTDGGTNPSNWAHNIDMGVLSLGMFFSNINNLTPNTQYYYRCYATNAGGNSWAASTATFTTLAPPTASISSATGTGTVTFNTSSGGITSLVGMLPTVVDCPPLSGLIFPDGLFSFDIINITPGSTVTVTITLPSAVPPDTQYWKCQKGEWVNASSLLGHKDGSNILTLTLTDGGLGDADGLANGTIVDPGGPAVPVPVQIRTVPPQPHVSPTLPQLKPARLSLQYMSVSPQQISAGQPVTILTNVVNTGDKAGSLNVALKINGQVEQTKMVNVGPQATQPIKFTVTKAQPGTYAIDVGGQNSSFTIVGAGSTTTSKSANVGMIAILLLGVLVLIAIVAVLLARRPT